MTNVTQTLRAYARKGRKTELIWRYGYNFRPSVSYRLQSLFRAAKVEQKILGDLNRDGIAISSVDEIPGIAQSFSELESATVDMLSARKEELEVLKKDAERTDAVGEKTFNVELLGSPVKFDPHSIFARFALQDVFLNTANAYFGMYARLRYYNVWKTFATSSKARESQLWHYDREDNYILKVFVYLMNVDEGTGPFTYAPKTHWKGHLRNKEPEFFLEKNVRRSTDEQMAAVVPQRDWIKATGKRGTIVFADTRGFHKGGEARTSDRLMYTCMFTSPSSESRRLLEHSGAVDLSNLNRLQLAALEI